MLKQPNKMKIVEKVAVAKDVFSMLAAICVAVWALYGTWVKNEEYIADLQVLELQQKTSMHSRVLTEMSIQKLHIKEEGTVFSISVQLKNVGNEDVRVSLNDKTILISKIDFEDGRPVYGTPIYIGNSRYRGFEKVVWDFIDIGPSEKYEISYVSRINGPGIYLVRFLSRMRSSSVKTDLSNNFGNNSIVEYNTGVDRIINVE